MWSYQTVNFIQLLALWNSTLHRPPGPATVATPNLSKWNNHSHTWCRAYHNLCGLYNQITCEVFVKAVLFAKTPDKYTSKFSTKSKCWSVDIWLSGYKHSLITSEFCSNQFIDISGGCTSQCWIIVTTSCEHIPWDVTICLFRDKNVSSVAISGTYQRS